MQRSVGELARRDDVAVGRQNVAKNASSSAADVGVAVNLGTDSIQTSSLVKFALPRLTPLPISVSPLYDNNTNFIRKVNPIALTSAFVAFVSTIPFIWDQQADGSPVTL